MKNTIFSLFDAHELTELFVFSVLSLVYTYIHGVIDETAYVRT